MRCFVILALIALLGCESGSEWPAELDPFAETNSGLSIPEPLGEPSAMERLTRAAANGEISVGAMHRYTIEQFFGLETTAPDSFRVTGGPTISDLLLEDLRADFGSLSPAEQEELGPWLLPAFHPEHPLFGENARTGSQSRASTGGASVFRTASLRGGDQNCPQDVLVHPERFATMNEATYCWTRLDNQIVLFWLREQTTLPEDEFADMLTQVASHAVAALDFYLPLFSSSRSELESRYGQESIALGLLPTDWMNWAAYEWRPGSVYGYHQWQTGPLPFSETMILFGPSTDEKRNDLAVGTMAHELVHVVQRQTQDAPRVGRYKWIVEGLATWGEKSYIESVLGDTEAFVSYYQSTYRSLPTALDSGLVKMAYPASLAWHEWVKDYGQGNLRQVISAYAGTGRTQPTMALMNLEEFWHPFVESLYNRGTWQRLEDQTVGIPEDLQIPLEMPPLELEELDTRVSGTLMPAVGGTRQQVSLSGQPRMVQIRTMPSPVTPNQSADSLRASVLLVEADTSVTIDVEGVTTICFSQDYPSCEGEEVYPASNELQVIFTNLSFQEKVRYFMVSTLPLKYFATKVRVGETEVPIREKTLTMERLLPDTGGEYKVKFTASEMWLEFEDEVYDRLIPDEAIPTVSPSAVDANISPAIIRGYVKANAQFRGFQEVELSNDESRDPMDLDGRTWLPLVSERSRSGDFFSTPHRFFVLADREWFEALGGGSGVLGPGGLVYLREIERLNRMRFPDGSFAETLHQYFRQMMTLGTEVNEQGRPLYTVDSDSGELMFRMGNMTLWLQPAGSDE